MKNSWLIWFIVVGVVITVLVAFNYQDEQAAIPLSEIFPETQEQPVQIEYEFVDEGESGAEQQVVQKKAPAKIAVEEAKAVEKKAAAVKPEAEEGPAQEIAAAVEEEIPVTQASYSIQVASFKTKDRANRKVGELAKEKLDAFVLSRDLEDKGTWYRVYVGKFNSRTDADAYLANVRKVASDSFIISLK